MFNFVGFFPHLTKDFREGSGENIPCQNRKKKKKTSSRLLRTRGGMLQQGFADGSAVNASKVKAVRDLNESVLKKNLMSWVVQYQSSKKDATRNETWTIESI